MITPDYTKTKKQKTNRVVHCMLLMIKILG